MLAVKYFSTVHASNSKNRGFQQQSDYELNIMNIRHRFTHHCRHSRPSLRVIVGSSGKFPTFVHLVTVTEETKPSKELCGAGCKSSNGRAPVISSAPLTKCRLGEQNIYMTSKKASRNLVLNFVRGASVVCTYNMHRVLTWRVPNIWIPDKCPESRRLVDHTAALCPVRKGFSL